MIDKSSGSSSDLPPLIIHGKAQKKALEPDKVSSARVKNIAKESMKERATSTESPQEIEKLKRMGRVYMGYPEESDSEENEDFLPSPSADAGNLTDSDASDDDFFTASERTSPPPSEEFFSVEKEETPDKVSLTKSQEDKELIRKGRAYLGYPESDSEEDEDIPYSSADAGSLTDSDSDFSDADLNPEELRRLAGLGEEAIKEAERLFPDPPDLEISDSGESLGSPIEEDSDTESLSSETEEEADAATLQATREKAREKERTQAEALAKLSKQNPNIEEHLLAREFDLLQYPPSSKKQAYIPQDLSPIREGKTLGKDEISSVSRASAEKSPPRHKMPPPQNPAIPSPRLTKGSLKKDTK